MVEALASYAPAGLRDAVVSPLTPQNLEDVMPRIIRPPRVGVPFWLLRRTLKTILREEGRIPVNLWSDRGDIVEVRTQGIIESQTNIVKSVTMNAKYAQGSDFEVKFVDGFSVKKPIRVEVKSSTLGLRNRKHEIRELLLTQESNGQLLGPWTKKLAKAEWNGLSLKDKELAIRGRLTEDDLILINAGEEDKKEKTAREILEESFLPQLERIWLKERKAGHTDKSIQVFPEPEQAQSLIEAESIQLFR